MRPIAEETAVKRVAAYKVQGRCLQSEHSVPHAEHEDYV